MPMLKHTPEAIGHIDPLSHCSENTALAIRNNADSVIFSAP